MGEAVESASRVGTGDNDMISVVDVGLQDESKNKKTRQSAAQLFIF
jgi:hypothetical protein